MSMATTRQFDILFLLNEFARSNNISLKPQDGYRDFLAEMKRLLLEQTQKPTVMHGLRTQSMFFYVVASLGGCSLISQEDSGEFYASASGLKRPDFRILTNTGQELFVEVKNFYPNDPLTPYRMKASYLSQLRGYVDQLGHPLKIAIYWPQWRGMWTLVSTETFHTDGTDYFLSISDAITANEMHLLGDCLIATVPSLTLRFLANLQEQEIIAPDGSYSESMTKGAKLYCGTKEIKDQFEKTLAFFS